jgi:hypothetical protein
LHIVFLKQKGIAATMICLDIYNMSRSFCVLNDFKVLRPPYFEDLPEVKRREYLTTYMSFCSILCITFSVSIVPSPTSTSSFSISVSSPSLFLFLFFSFDCPEGVGVSSSVGFVESFLTPEFRPFGLPVPWSPPSLSHVEHLPFLAYHRYTFLLLPVVL